MTRLRVALLQYPIVWANKKANLELAKQRIAAIEGQADIAILPEMFATGFCTDHPELAEAMDGEIMHSLQALADTHNIAIVSSFICIGERRKGLGRILPPKLVNRGFMITPNAPVQIQDKRHLYAHGGEDKFFQSAKKRTIFEYNGVKIQLLVCYDLRFPVWARNNSGYDYDVLLVVANWPAIRIKYWDALIAARATENQCYIAAVNCVGEDGTGLHYNGHSVAYNTRLEDMTEFKDNEEGTRIAEFDIDALQHFREVLPLWKDADPFTINC